MPQKAVRVWDGILKSSSAVPTIFLREIYKVDLTLPETRCVIRSTEIRRYAHGMRRITREIFSLDLNNKVHDAEILTRNGYEVRSRGNYL